MDIVTFHHSPNSRSAGTRVLLEELHAPFKLHAVNMKRGDQRKPDYLAINPMGKVPALTHHGVLIAEQAAVFMYLADLFSEKGLAPALDDPLRGTYLRWMVFYGSCFEPAVVDRALKREPAPPGMNPYGDFDTMLDNVVMQLRKGPCILGTRFSAADILWASGLQWIVMFKLVPELPEIMDYVARITARPSFARAAELDAELATQHEAEAAAG